MVELYFGVLFPASCPGPTPLPTTSNVHRSEERGDPTIKTIVNKTRRPLRIPLPRGKTLHLGPAGRGQVHPDALERPALQKLVKAGDIEVLDEGQGPAGADGRGSGRVQGSTQGVWSPANDRSRKGDR